MEGQAIRDQGSGVRDGIEAGDNTTYEFKKPVNSSLIESSVQVGKRLTRELFHGYLIAAGESLGTVQQFQGRYFAHLRVDHREKCGQGQDEGYGGQPEGGRMLKLVAHLGVDHREKHGQGQDEGY